MRIETKEYLDYEDVLIKPKRSSLESRKEVDLHRDFTFKWSQREWSGVPILASNMDTVGTFEMQKALQEYSIPTMLHKFYSSDEIRHHLLEDTSEWAIDYTFLSYGIRSEDIENFLSFVEEHGFEHEIIVAFDVANGYTERYVKYISDFRNSYPDTTIIAGNVATPEATEALIFAGADIVKIGIGSGGQCITRMKAGVGVPQLTSVIECGDAAHGLGAHIIADGGIKKVCDVGKAFGAGADFVMIGSMLAGHEESGGEHFINEDGTSQKEVYGMSSEYAMKKHYGKKDDYRSSEGEYNLVKYRGPVKNTIEDILGGLRSTMTYIGANRLKDISKCTTFIKVGRIK